MDVVRTVILLLHPILAIGLLVWIWKQYSWRKKGFDLKGEERKKALSSHEKNGNRLVSATFVVICIAFASNAVVGLRDGDKLFASLIPGSLHGFMGPVGFALLYILARMGRKARDARQEGRKFRHIALKHGRAADLVVVLVFINAFLGFLYIFTVL